MSTYHTHIPSNTDSNFDRLFLSNHSLTNIKCLRFPLKTRSFEFCNVHSVPEITRISQNQRGVTLDLPHPLHLGGQL